MNKRYIYFFICLLSAFGFFQAFAETIIVKTKAQENRLAMFQYRVPRGYDANRGETYRVLVIFGGRNTDGKADASGRMGWGEWCDENGIFLICPGFQNDDYWEPKEWSVINGMHDIPNKVKNQIDDLIANIVKSATGTSGSGTTTYHTSRGYEFGSICYSMGGGTVSTWSSISYSWTEYTIDDILYCPH